MDYISHALCNETCTRLKELANVLPGSLAESHLRLPKKCCSPESLHARGVNVQASPISFPFAARCATRGLDGMFLFFLLKEAHFYLCSLQITSRCATRGHYFCPIYKKCPVIPNPSGILPVSSIRPSHAARFHRSAPRS
jgi:hypothetical protein